MFANSLDFPYRLANSLEWAVGLVKREEFVELLEFIEFIGFVGFVELLEFVGFVELLGFVEIDGDR